MKVISIKVEEKLWDRLKERVHYHGQLTHLVRHYIEQGLERDDAEDSGRRGEPER